MEPRKVAQACLLMVRQQECSASPLTLYRGKLHTLQGGAGSACFWHMNAVVALADRSWNVQVRRMAKEAGAEESASYLSSPGATPVVRKLGRSKCVWLLLVLASLDLQWWLRCTPQNIKLQPKMSIVDWYKRSMCRSRPTQKRTYCDVVG